MTAIFTQWLREDTKCSWKKLIECMKKCDMANFAREMEIALGLAVQGNFRELFMHVVEDHSLFYLSPKNISVKCRNNKI